MLFEVEDNVLLVKLQNGRTNAMNYEELMQLKNSINEVTSIKEIQGFILTGTGGFYSSEFDLPSILNFKTVDKAIVSLHLAEEVLLNLFSCTKPVIAAINGHCTAAGLMTAMATDYRLGLNDSKIRLGMSEIKIGVSLMPAARKSSVLTENAAKKMTQSHLGIVYRGGL